MLLGLMGERGKVRELCDFGDSTPAGPAFRVRIALEFAVAVMAFVRFLGFARSCAGLEGTFSLSSPVDISSLKIISTLQI